MARASLTIAAATLVLAVSAPLAHAQMGSAVPPAPPGAMPHGTMMHGQHAVPGPTTAGGMGMPGPAGSASTYGMGGMTSQGGAMGGSGMMGSGPSAATPAQPFAGVQLPQQPNVGNGAYNGGGVVLEYLPDGTTRVVR